MPHRAELLLATFETHDVKRLVVSRPEGFDYAPGQAVELAIDRDKWRDEARPFSITSLPSDRVLEFIIKVYPERDEVTARLDELVPGDTLLVSDPFGSFRYAGPGVFLAGGTGITPFLAILRDLERRGELGDQRLIYANHAPRDVICEKELRHLLGDRLMLTCSRESGPGCEKRRIDRVYLEEKLDRFDGRFYLCGPPNFVKDLKGTLVDLGASAADIVI